MESTVGKASMNVRRAAVAVRPRRPRTPCAGTSWLIELGGTGYRLGENSCAIDCRNASWVASPLQREATVRPAKKRPSCWSGQSLRLDPRTECPTPVTVSSRTFGSPLATAPASPIGVRVSRVPE